ENGEFAFFEFGQWCPFDLYRLLSLFITPDNNLKTRIIAQAIVDDKTQLSYEWVFQCVKEATGMLPKVFVTDGDPAINANYLQSKDYLTKVLGCNPQSWARTFTNRYFTASIQTTSRNEGENSTLKRLFGDSNTCPLYNAQLLIDFIGYVTLFNTFKASTYKANIIFKAIDCFEQVNTDYL
ncbi:hypothetical protein RhiirC2_788542, partial [Rhizophagus irregularis]